MNYKIAGNLSRFIFRGKRSASPNTHGTLKPMVLLTRFWKVLLSGCLDAIRDEDDQHDPERLWAFEKRRPVSGQTKMHEQIDRHSH